MKNLKKDLQTATREIEALIKKLERISAAVDKLEKPKAAKRTVSKKAVTKKGEATAAVLAIVNQSKKGVDTATVMKKTGFDRKKVANLFASRNVSMKMRHMFHLIKL